MKIGQRVKHPTYGEGTIIAIEDTIRLGDGKTWPRESQSSITRSTNGWSRYSGYLNAGIKFDKGGPQGWSLDASNDLRSIVGLDGVPIVFTQQVEF